MKDWGLIYLLAVVLLLSPAYAELNVSAGHIYDVNLYVSVPLQGSSWLGLYGFVPSVNQKFPASYFETAFAQVENLTPTSDVRSVELNTSKTLAYPSVSDPSNWYAVISPAGDINLHALDSTCDANLDVLVEGNFCDDCLPSKTYEENAWIFVNDVNLCAKRVTLWGEVNSFLLEYNDSPVYLSPLSEFNLDGNTYNFSFLVSATGESLYLYLVRSHIVCGDGVCDPGEEGNCGDCVSLEVNVSPDTQTIDANESTQYDITLTNTGDNDLSVELSLQKISGPEGYTYTFDATTLTVLSHSSRTLKLTIAASDGGSYLFRVVAKVGNVDVPSNSFYLIVRAPTPPPEGGGGGAGGVPETNVSEENVTPTEENKVVVTPRGYYIPWLGCISYLHVYSPDSVKLGLKEEKNVPVVIQNAGTCEENVELNIEGVTPDFYKGVPRNFALSKGQTVTVEVTFVGAKAGTFEAFLVAKGYYPAKRKITIIVTGEKAVERNCSSNIMILSPDVVDFVEGKEVNKVAEVVNEGTCIEDVSLKLTKEVEGVPVTIDAREMRLPPGERFLYTPPRLATGQYKLTITAAGYTKETIINVKSQASVTGVVESLVVRARFFLLIMLLLVLLAAVSYIRSRYLS